ncbi:MAG TPA: hypothetical protein VFH27_05590 [Longimicrobiaceae bacterium]|nr:hypothetical protein [Longimicrobiaceae bacterium]
MSFTLEMKIGGLCVLVPATDGKMHVLLPRTQGTGQGCMTVHETRIYFDRRYLTGSNQPPTDPNLREYDSFLYGSIVVGDEPASAVTHVPLTVLELPSRIHGDCLDANGGGRLDGRLTLLRGAFTATAPGSCWLVPGLGAWPLTFQARWTVQMPGDFLVWNISSLIGGAPPPMRVLWPVDTGTGSLLEVEVVHGIASEMPGAGQPPVPPPVGSPPLHIATCLPVLFQDFQMPNVTYLGELPCADAPAADLPLMDMTTTFSCMLTAGEMP